MQRFKNYLPLLLLALLTGLAGCADRTVKVYEANLPVYMDAAVWRAGSFTMEAPRTLERPGKIYLYNDLLIVNDLMKGVHIFDNTNPSAPVSLGFLPVHANVDIAVRNNILYLDSYTDLLSFDISNPSQPVYLSRVENVFEFTNYIELDGFNENMPMAYPNPSLGIVTGWTQGETTEEVYGYNRGGGVFTALESFDGGSSGSPSVIGMGGSLARFTIADHYLYTLESWQLGVFDLSDGMVHTTDISLTRSSETLFPYGNNLFIGTTTGLLIYDITNGGNPTPLADFAHVNSCDPVAVQGDKAFVTLRTGTNCNGNTNSLLVIDLVDIRNPQLMYEFPMTNPRGLALDGSTLFLCDGPDGLEVYDRTDLAMINQSLISSFPGITSSDVIAHDQVLVMTADEGIYQYSYADLQNIVQLSLIPAAH